MEREEGRLHFTDLVVNELLEPFYLLETKAAELISLENKQVFQRLGGVGGVDYLVFDNDRVEFEENELKELDESGPEMILWEVAKRLRESVDVFLKPDEEIEDLQIEQISMVWDMAKDLFIEGGNKLKENGLQGSKFIRALGDCEHELRSNAAVSLAKRLREYSGTFVDDFERLKDLVFNWAERIESVVMYEQNLLSLDDLRYYFRDNFRIVAKQYWNNEKLIVEQVLREPRGIVYSVFDGVLARSIVSNILMNAQEHSGRELGELQVYVWMGVNSDFEFVMVVGDNGDGFDRKVVPKRGWVPEGYTTSDGGRGMGSIKLCIEEMGGSAEIIQIEDPGELNVKSVIKFVLPVGWE